MRMMQLADKWKRARMKTRMAAILPRRHADDGGEKMADEVERGYM